VGLEPSREPSRPRLGSGPSAVDRTERGLISRCLSEAGTLPGISYREDRSDPEIGGVAVPVSILLVLVTQPTTPRMTWTGHRGAVRAQGGLPSRYCNPRFAVLPPQYLIGWPFQHSHVSAALSNTLCSNLDLAERKMGTLPLDVSPSADGT
jgi:hypothetical protein